MANPFKLAGATELVRINRAEAMIAIVPDSDQAGVAAVLHHLDSVDEVLASEGELLDALRGRLNWREPRREIRTLADTICATCRRLEQERVRAQSSRHELKTLTLANVRAELAG